MKKIYEKHPVIRYILGAYIKFLIFFLILFTVLFGIFEFTGFYTKIETALDLKYTSPFVLGPLFAFPVLAVLSFFIGMMLYLYKYKRTRLKSVFYKVFSNILNPKQPDLIERGNRNVAKR